MAEQDLDQLHDNAAQQRHAIAQDMEYVGDRVSPGRIVERRRAAVTGRVRDMRSSVFGSPSQSSSGGGDSSARDKASEALDTVKEKAPDSTADFTEGNPLAAGLIGVGIGLLVATIIPETREEKQLAGRAQSHLDDAAEELGRSGREAAKNVKPAAQDAAQKVKDSATDSAENVQADTKAAAQGVRSTAEDKRDELQS